MESILKKLTFETFGGHDPASRLPTQSEETYKNRFDSELLSETVSHSTNHGFVSPTRLLTSTHCWFNVCDQVLPHDMQQYCYMKVFCVADVYMKKKRRVRLPATGMQRLATAATRKPASERRRWTVRAVLWQNRMEARDCFTLHKSRTAT